MEISDIIHVGTSRVVGDTPKIKCESCEDLVENVWCIGPNGDGYCDSCTGAWIEKKIIEREREVLEKAALIAFGKTQDKELMELIRSVTSFISGDELRGGRR